MKSHRSRDSFLALHLGLRQVQPRSHRTVPGPAGTGASVQGELRGGHEAEKAPWAGGVWTPDRLLGLVPIGGAERALKLGAGRGQRAAARAKKGF